MLYSTETNKSLPLPLPPPPPPFTTENQKIAHICLFSILNVLQCHSGPTDGAVYSMDPQEENSIGLLQYQVQLGT